MGLDVWFAEDIRNAILAADEATSATAEVARSQKAQTLDLITEKLREELPEGTSQVLLDALHQAAIGNMNALRYYRQGYKAALTTLALAFGLAPQIISRRGVRQNEPQADSTAGDVGLLQATPGHRRSIGSSDGQGAGQGTQAKSRGPGRCR